MRRVASLWMVWGIFGFGSAWAQQPAQEGPGACESDTDCLEGQRCGDEGECQDEPEGEQTGPTPAGIQIGELEGATEAPELSDAQIRWLKPRRHLMGQVPRAQTDFTAYALEFGEVRVGLANITFGAAPRVQVATAPLMWALDVQNAQLKANPIRFGGLDVAIEGSFYGIPLEDFEASYRGLGGTVSLQVMERLSAHGGFSWASLAFGGAPDGLMPLAENSLLISQNEDLEDFVRQIQESDTVSGVLEDGEINITAEALILRFATDYRFNRRDSLVLQVQAMIWGNAKGNVELPPILGLEDALSVKREETVSASDAYTASLSWHSAWKRWEFRIGAGVASQPGAWLFQAMDVSYRFGGETRTSERRTRNTWRRNRGDQGRGDQEP
ncbi:MAG: hypothetical protein VX519_01735 [Myxococcota bacterium]|nr:hypothetical protein [Myxococcota bacterium]